MEVARHVQSNQSRKLGICLQYIKKKSVAAAFMFSYDAKHSDVLRRSKHVRRCLFLIETFVKAKGT